MQIVQVFQKTEKREKVPVGPGSRECKAGHETNNCEELCVRWKGLCALGKWGEEYERAEVGVANSAFPPEDRK